MLEDILVVVKGGGDLASGVAHRLHRVGMRVIVTELADSSLKDRFEQARASGLPGIPRDELLVYLRDAADALDHMSARFSLQHLDIKPENLLIVGDRVKVADFGLVKDVQDATMSLMGGMTPIYACPEVFDARPSLQSLLRPAAR